MDIRTKVINRARELFISMGIRNITMDYLAVDLGMSKRTLYECFGQKDALVFEVLCEILHLENEGLTQIAESSENVVEALFLIIRRKKELHASLPRVFVEDVEKYMPIVRDQLFQSTDLRMKNSLSYVLLDRGVKEGIFRNDLNIKVVDQFILDIIQYFHTNKRIAVSDLNNDEMLNNILIPYLRGLATLKGLDLINKFFEQKYESKE